MRREHAPVAEKDEPKCIACPGPNRANAAVTDDASRHYCAACALSLADVLWAELGEAWREASQP